MPRHKNAAPLLRMVPYAALAGIVLTATGCGGSGEATPAANEASQSSSARPQFRFDYLGGGPRVIQVYPGTSESAADKRSNGTYEHGQTAGVTCYKLGRLVTSRTDLGEREESSNVWYRLDTQEIRYATDVYGNIVPGDASVPECTD